MTIWADIVDPVSSIAVLTSLVSAVLGGVMTKFKHWIPSEESIKQKIDSAKSEHCEGLVSSLRRVLDDYNSFDMQGQIPSEIDALSTYTKFLMTITRRIYSFELVRCRIANGYAVLFTTMIIGTLLFIVALVAIIFGMIVIGPYVSAIAITIILVQLYYLALIFLANRKLNQEVCDVWKSN